MPDCKPVTINGYDTYYVECSDGHGDYLLIGIPSNANPDISDIVTQTIDGHFITEVGYISQDGVRFIKAYYC